MLVTLNDVLPAAREGYYAVPAFDTREDLMIRAVLETAEQQRSPVIVMLLEPELTGNGMPYAAGLAKVAADYHSVPVVLHLDHSTNVELIRACLEYGFSSVMFDGSRLPFDENAAITKSVVEMAHPRGVTVEAELGYVGGRTLDDKGSTESVLTDPADVVRFVEATGCDALAVSIGTSHGVYRSQPTLNIDRLREIHAVSPVPLVLHGGSGTPDDQVQDAIRHGISKVNVYAELRQAMYAGLNEAANSFDRSDPLPNEMLQPIRDRLDETIAQKIRMCYARGKAPGQPPTPPYESEGGSYTG